MLLKKRIHKGHILIYAWRARTMDREQSQHQGTRMLKNPTLSSGSIPQIKNKGDHYILLKKNLTNPFKNK